MGRRSSKASARRAVATTHRAALKCLLHDRTGETARDLDQRRPSDLKTEETSMSSRPIVAIPAAYKRRYARMHPARQMVGLMLWLPASVVILFSLCYIGALHAPAPHDVPIGVVGTSTNDQQLASDLQASSKGALRVNTIRAANAAAVRSGKLAAAFVPGSPGHPAKVIVASANGYQLAEYAQQTLAPLAAAERTTVRVDDVAPLPAGHDNLGTVSFFITLVATLGGYLLGVFCGQQGAPLRRRDRWSVVAAMGALLSLLVTGISGPILGAFTGHFFEAWAVTYATVLVAGLVTDALGYYFGRFLIVPALVLFVFINVPSGGGTYPVTFVPGIFRWLNHIVLSSYDVPLMRHVLYGVGPHVARGIYGLAAYGATGVILALAGPYFVRWRQHRRAKFGLSPRGMMGDASLQLALGSTTSGPDNVTLTADDRSL
jgi:hypothetical protein